MGAGNFLSHHMGMRGHFPGMILYNLLITADDFQGLQRFKELTDSLIVNKEFISFSADHFRLRKWNSRSMKRRNTHKLLHMERTRLSTIKTKRSFIHAHNVEGFDQFLLVNIPVKLFAY